MFTSVQGSWNVFHWLRHNDKIHLLSLVTLHSYTFWLVHKNSTLTEQLTSHDQWKMFLNYGIVWHEQEKRHCDSIRPLELPVPIYGGLSQDIPVEVLIIWILIGLEQRAHQNEFSKPSKLCNRSLLALVCTCFSFKIHITWHAIWVQLRLVDVLSFFNTNIDFSACVLVS